MNKKMKFTIGSDPELMLVNTTTGEIVSSLPVLPDKHNPLDLGNGIYVYSDNILAEAKFPPVDNKKDFIGVFRTAFASMKKQLNGKFSIVPKASHVYADKELQDEKAWEIGCTANYNAYTEKQNPIVEFQNGLRTGSCHIHVGNKTLTDFHMRHKAIRLLDIFVGLSSIIFDKDVEASRARRKYYGACGEFRPTPYGLEWRVLSPFVLHTPELVGLTYDLVDYTMSLIESGHTDKLLKIVDSVQVAKAINECNAKLAREILASLKMPAKFMKRIEAEYDTANFEKNWGI